MSLVIAFSGRDAVIAGDRRSIAFSGDCRALEDELYSGGIHNDEELLKRARELSATIYVSDNREKVWQDGDVLVGEVTEVSASSSKRRRVYVTSGAYLIVDVVDGNATISGKGGTSLVILGNRYTRDAAGRALQRLSRIDAQSVMDVMKKVGAESATMSKEYTMLRVSTKHGDPAAHLMQTFLRDCERMGWRV